MAGACGASLRRLADASYRYSSSSGSKGVEETPAAFKGERLPRFSGSRARYIWAMANGIGSTVDVEQAKGGELKLGGSVAKKVVTQPA